MLGLSLAACVFVPSGKKMISSAETVLGQKKLSDDIVSSALRINENVNVEIFNLPKVYMLPMDLSPAPRPDPSKFTEDSYEDQSISVKCWHERITFTNQKPVDANFADIRIAHPSQLRTAFAGGVYGYVKRSYTSKMAELNNAVIAVNADYYNYRSDGLLIRQGTLYRERPFDIDTLFIDSNGDLKVMRDYEAVNSQYYKKNEILQTIVFGPLLVENGKALEKLNIVNVVDCGATGLNPRTAIGQLGPLHYLLCTIDGRSKQSAGVTVKGLAKIMEDKNCVIAYNLDGGQSTTMVFNGRLYNQVSGEGERAMSDCLYFASAVPESEWN